MKVSQLIEALQSMPQDSPVFIHDEDTEWLLPMVEQSERGPAVRLMRGLNMAEVSGNVVVIRSAGYNQ